MIILIYLGMPQMHIFLNVHHPVVCSSCWYHPPRSVKVTGDHAVHCRTYK